MLEVLRFDVDKDVEMTLIQMHIDMQKHGMGGEDVSSELAMETFVELSEGVQVIGPEEEDFISEHL